MKIIYANEYDSFIMSYRINAENAARYGKLDALKGMCENKFRLSKSRNRLFRIAVTYGHLEVAVFLKSIYKIYKLNQYVPIACENGHLPLVKFLHEKGASLRTGSNLSLIISEENNQYEIILYLLENGADHWVMEMSKPGTKEKLNMESVKALIREKIEKEQEEAEEED